MAGEQIRYYAGVQFGMDPEFFFKKGGSIIGAEKVIPEGIKVAGRDARDINRTPSFVLDGVQVELNPRPHTCREEMGDELQVAFKGLKSHLLAMGQKDISASFDAVVALDQKELDSLSDRAKQFGCAPSKNAYDHTASIAIKGDTYLKRAAGGHIHLGLTGHTKIMKERERLVPLLDILLGIPCVLVDRNPEAAERRKHYGRAGEYRLPDHGLEYRTLSNFWLRSYPLMSFVLGQARQAVNVLNVATGGPGLYDKMGNGVYWTSSSYNPEKDLLSRVNLGEVAEAINTNSLDLASKVFYGAVAPFIKERFNLGFGLEGKNLPDFDYFLKRVHEKGLEAWFPEDPLDHWCNKPVSHHTGWESFLGQVVHPKRLIAEAKWPTVLKNTLNL